MIFSGNFCIKKIARVYLIIHEFLCRANMQTERERDNAFATHAFVVSDTFICNERRQVVVRSSEVT